MSTYSSIQYIKELSYELPKIINILEKEANQNSIKQITLLKLNDTVCDLREEALYLIKFLNKNQDNFC